MITYQIQVFTKTNSVSFSGVLISFQFSALKCFMEQVSSFEDLDSSWLSAQLEKDSPVVNIFICVQSKLDTPKAMKVIFTVTIYK